MVITNLLSKCILGKIEKVKSAYEPCDPSDCAYTGFSSMKRLGIFLLLPSHGSAGIH